MISEINEYPLSPLKAIRAHCLECAETPKEVRLCPITRCPLWTYRFGKGKPHHLSEEMRERLSHLHKAKQKEE